MPQVRSLPLTADLCNKPRYARLPVDHVLDVRCKVYENGRVAADPETLSLLEQFSERETEDGTGLHRSRIRLLRHGGSVIRKTYEKI